MVELLALAHERVCEAELAEISGIGPSRLARYGARILDIVRGDGEDG